MATSVAENSVPTHQPATGQTRSITFRALELVGRSLFPIVATMVLAGTVIWGPWITLALAIIVFVLVSGLA